MKKLFALIVIGGLLVGATAALASAPVEGWWVHPTDKAPQNEVINIQGAVDARIMELIDQYGAGADGKSAYEIAVENGFVGSEMDWLDSLIGEQGPQGEQGLSGDDGQDGVNGLSAYELAVLNGFEGTEQDWLDSLHGGAPGPQGEPGEDGNSAYEVAVENGFTGTLSEWLDSLVGEGVPTGGSAGQALVKASGDDYDTTWADVLTNEDLQEINEKNDEQDGRIGSIENWQDSVNSRMDQFEDRLSDLEDPQFILGLNLRLTDTKRTTLEAFGDYSVTRGEVDRYGLRLTFKLGKSYEEKLIENLQAEVEELKALLSKKE